MKRRIYEKLEIYFYGIFLVLFVCIVVSCSESDKTDSSILPFDPTKEIVITSFTPETGGYQDQIIIYGSNFGTDTAHVSLSIGGKEAVLVGVQSDKMYAFVPSGAYSGIIIVSITDDDGNVHTATASQIFVYERKTVVGTLCGYQNDDDSQGEIWGSFDICTGFQAEGCMTFDPLYPERLYIAFDRSDGFIQVLNLETRETSRLMTSSKFGTQRLRNIDFSLDGNYMLVSTDRNDNGTKTTSVWIVTRNSDGTFSDSSSCQALVAYQQCNGVAVHPVNGEVYFNSYTNGILFRMSLDDYFEGKAAGTWTGYLDDGAFTELFKIQDPSYEFQITIHPTGDYAYITVINRSYILRTDYDWINKKFTTPYTVIGYNGDGDWVDAVGTNARVNRPYQGVFVKNPDYVEEGREDVYDYYFCDCSNYCIRYITPDGVVRTYAGRSTATNGNIWGTEDGDLRNAARFRDVTGIAYDEDTDMFYVLDHNNRRIRTIGEEEDEETESTETTEDSAEE